ncbi:basic proline-rich protein-like [Sceloporus undulatus]|uniref:basic proline-rich protein-like n=1 Tax=Sceloporus undulatus TaxID=8520 RepID=UPI001C4BE66C|nr:basic proline-rich protein-like [Sceloporus undulatus]
MERDMNVDQAQASKGIKKKASTEAMAPKQGATSHRGTPEMVSLPAPPLYRTRHSEDHSSAEQRPSTPAGPTEPSRRGPPEVKTPLPGPPSPRLRPSEERSPAEQRLVMPPGSLEPARRGPPEVKAPVPGPPSPRSKPLEDHGPAEQRPLMPAGPSEPSLRGPPEVKAPVPGAPSPQSKPLEDHGPAEQRPLMPAGPSEPSRRGPPEGKSPVPGPPSPRSKPLEDHGPAEQRPLTPAGPSEPARASVNRGPAAVRPLLDQGPIQSSRVSESSPVKRGDVPHGRLRHPGPQRSSPESSINWCCSTVGLLSVCTILLAMVVTMNGQVSNLMERTEEHEAVVKLHVIILTDILMALQIGKGGVMYTGLDQKGCAYLQDGHLGSQQCTELAYVICEAKTLFD